MAKPRIIRILRNGQITIPKDFRTELGWGEDDVLEVSVTDGKISLTQAITRAQGSSPWLKELYDTFAPVRDNFAASGMTEDEINAELDEAVREARAEGRNAA